MMYISNNFIFLLGVIDFNNLPRLVFPYTAIFNDGTVFGAQWKSLVEHDRAKIHQGIKRYNKRNAFIEET